MERYITDAIYDNTEQPGTLEVERAVMRYNEKLSGYMSEKEYLRIEEELNRIHAMIEKEWFHRGFLEGIRFLLKCI